MRSLKHRNLIMLLGTLVILVTSIIGLGFYINNRDVAAAIIKAQGDLATSAEIINTKYPGSWSVRDGDLYKGPIKISLNNDLVDDLSRLTGDTVTIFLEETRVATTVRSSNGERAIGTNVAANVAQAVLKDGQTYLGEANVVGQRYQTGYVPLRAENGKIIGMFYVGISHAYVQEIITRPLITMGVLGLAITILVGLLTWLFIQRVTNHPLHNIILANSEVATSQIAEEIEVSSAKQIGKLEDAFNQMVEQIESLTGKINLAANINIEGVSTESGINTVIEPIKPEPVSRLDTPWCNGDEGMPKGLNKSTLGQIVQLLQATRRPISVEEVAEGVKMTRVTVRRYLEFLEQRGILKSEQKYGKVGRPVKLFIPL